jgi:hypothetical protein
MPPKHQTSAVKDYPPYLDYPKPRKPQTNADRMIAMIQNGQASDLLDWWQEIFEDGVPGDDYFAWWLRQPVKDGDNDG